MKISKETHNNIQAIVNNYAKYSDMDGGYILEGNIDSRDLVASLMKDFPDMCNEATGCDNKMYESYMLPALIKLFENPTDIDAKIDFEHAWIGGVTYYFQATIDTLLADAMGDYNADYNASKRIKGWCHE